MIDDIYSIVKNYSFLDKHSYIKLKLLKNQGLCNTTYLLSTSKNRYIIKKFEKSVHVDKKFEFNIQLLSYKKEIGSKPIILDFTNQIMISEFLNGEHKNILKRYDLISLANVLRNLHKIKIHGKPFDIKRYITENNNKIDKKFKSALIQIKKYKKEFVLCHNDLNPKNIIFLNNTKFIDWEFASINDRYFDLASIVVEFNLNKKDEKYFLRSYFKKNKYNRKKLETYKIIYKHICKVWSINHNAKKQDAKINQ